MKKFFCIVLCVMTLFAFAACGSKADPASFPATSEQLTQSMLDGDFQSVVALGDSTFKRNLTPEVLQMQWEQFTDGIGEYDGIIDTKVSSEGGYTVIEQMNSFPHINLKLTYTFNDTDGTLAGLWTTTVSKPIEPQSTDAYEEIPITLGKENPLDGLITMPKGGTNLPAVVLVHGSGANDMDETIGTGGNKPLADIAHGLAEQGIASIRYNKVTNQYPNAVSAAELTIEYEVLNDASAAYALLAEYEGIDPSKVFIIGHSLGGMMAPKLTELTGAAGYASLGGSPRHFADIIYDQNVNVIEEADASDEEKELALAQVAGMVDAAKNAVAGDPTILLGYSGHYWASYNALDMKNVIESLTVPAFIAQGTDDFQIYADKDFTAWQELLPDRDTVDFQLYDGLNHLFMKSNGKTDITEYNPSAHVQQAVIDDIAGFIGNQ
ncbi:DUF3887 domain-containing protein [Christensenellaceae bacterium OttesenSCG-928-K19]|nr:DUF3887 domain-containing protein [Christensenellaceae bacterium OttesenSCG-928-K19]